jgi:hypothetical protein
MMETQQIRTSLIRILQRAYSGELAAAYAYRGHWKSLSNPGEIAGIKRIESEEWTHRANVGRMLSSFGSGPVRIKELRCRLVGRAVGLACHAFGWFLPMYTAGKLESANTEEYRTAASYARELGLTDFDQELTVMSAVEKEHELFFLGAVSNHRLLPLAFRVFDWGNPESEVTIDDAWAEAQSARPPHPSIR